MVEEKLPVGLFGKVGTRSQASATQAKLISIQTTSKHLFMFLSACHDVSHVNSYTCCCLNCQQTGKRELIKEN